MPLSRASTRGRYSRIVGVTRSLPPLPPLAGDVAHGAPTPPPRQDVSLEPRREAPQGDPPRRASARDEESCQVVQRPQGEACALPASPCQDRVPPEPVVRERQDQAPPPRQVPVTSAGCCAFTPELRHLVWPGKFKSDLPPRYDGTPDPAEFLQLYELSIEAANDDENIMANWFPMALKDDCRWKMTPMGSLESLLWLRGAGS